MQAVVHSNCKYYSVSRTLAENGISIQIVWFCFPIQTQLSRVKNSCLCMYIYLRVNVNLILNPIELHIDITNEQWPHNNLIQWQLQVGSTLSGSIQFHPSLQESLSSRHLSRYLLYGNERGVLFHFPLYFFIKDQVWQEIIFMACQL